MSQVKSSWQTALYDPQLMFRAFRFLENQVASKLPASYQQVTGKLNYAHDEEDLVEMTFCFKITPKKAKYSRMMLLF